MRACVFVCRDSGAPVASANDSGDTARDINVDGRIFNGSGHLSCSSDSLTMETEDAMAKFTVIHTKQQTTLTIATPQGEPLSLDKMTGDGTPTVVRTLRPGATETVAVDPGLYRILSDSVHVTSSGPVALDQVNGKDDPP